MAERLGILGHFAQEDAFRQNASSGIILAHVRRYRLTVALKRLGHELEVLTRERAVVKMQNDKAAFRSARKADGIGIGKGRRYDLLLIRYALYGTYPVAQLAGCFKPQLLGCLEHFRRELVNELGSLAAEDEAHLLYGEAVLLCRELSPAPATAVTHVVVEAGSVLSDIAREAP